MVGKPQITETVLQEIRQMLAAGASQQDVIDEMGVSRYTVRKALRGQEWIEQERERWRRADAERVPRRAQDPDYRAYQAEWEARTGRKEQVRQRMAELRARRRAAANK